MKSAYKVVDRMLKRVGIINGLPRIINVDTSARVLGYTEVNTMATTPFSRTKTHKAWFSGSAQISNGDLIQDAVDSAYYLVMSLKAEYSGNHVAYFDGTLYAANEVASIKRYSEVKNDFGRVIDPAFADVYTGVRLMVTAVTIDDIEQDDRIHAKDKIKVVLQSKYDVKVGDRITTSGGDVLKINAVVKSDLQNLLTVHAEPDTR